MSRQLLETYITRTAPASMARERKLTVWSPILPAKTHWQLLHQLDCSRVAKERSLLEQWPDSPATCCSPKSPSVLAPRARESSASSGECSLQSCSLRIGVTSEERTSEDLITNVGTSYAVVGVICNKHSRLSTILTIVLSKSSLQCVGELRLSRGEAICFLCRVQ